MNRERLPATRQSITHKAQVASTEFYITVGMFEDGRPGEMFITIAKEGSTMSGVFDSFGIAVSMLLQSGWTIEQLSRKFIGSTFEPQGHTTNQDVPIASSIVDYIFKWALQEFGKGADTPGNTDQVERETPDEATTEYPLSNL